MIFKSKPDVRSWFPALVSQSGGGVVYAIKWPGARAIWPPAVLWGGTCFWPYVSSMASPGVSLDLSFHGLEKLGIALSGP